MGRLDDDLDVDAMMGKEIADRAGLAELLDAQGPYAVAPDRTEPGKKAAGCPSMTLTIPQSRSISAPTSLPIG